MKVVYVSGSHPRHSSIARSLAKAGMLAGWIVEDRLTMTPQPDPGLSARLARLFKRHFELREEAEDHFFGTDFKESAEYAQMLSVPREQLNGPEVMRFLTDTAPDLLLSYGCHKLTPATLSTARYGWNIHGGLSPWYRGVMTHYWPSYNLEPQMTGMTLHETTGSIDGGDILHQTAAQLVRGDGLHMLAGRTVRNFADAISGVIADLLSRNPLKPVHQSTTGRLWIQSMWRPEHLLPIYEHYGDRIVDRVIDGDLVGKEPVLASLIGTANGKGAV